MVYVLKEKLERVRLSKLGTRGPARMLPQKFFVSEMPFLAAVVRRTFPVNIYEGKYSS